MSSGYSGHCLPESGLLASAIHRGPPTVGKEHPAMSTIARRLVATSMLIGALAGATALAASPAYAAPANDNFANATVLPNISGQTPFTTNNSTATAEPGEPANFQGHAARHSIWFTWTAPSTMRVV